MFLSAISSLIGLVGFFFYKILFYIGGGISFIFLIIFMIDNIIKKDRIEVKAIRAKKRYQASEGSKIYYANNDKEVKNLITQYRIGVIGGRSVAYVLFCIVLFVVFRGAGFAWLGIFFGFFYIPQIIGSIRGR